jgi:hypothetical protein
MTSLPEHVREKVQRILDAAAREKLAAQLPKPKPKPERKAKAA